MDKEMLSEVVKCVPSVIGDYYTEHENAILSWSSIISETLAVGFAMKDGQFIIDTIKDGYSALAMEPDPEIRKEIRKSVLRDIGFKVVRLAAFYAASVAATLINKKHNDKKIADLTAALGVAQNAIVQYQIWQKEARKELGTEKAKEVGQKVVQEEVKKNPQTDENTLGKPDDKKIEGPAMQTMWCWYDSNTPERYLWSRKSPVDVERWVLDQNAMFAKHKQDGNKLSINAFYEFLCEGLDQNYVVNGLYGNPDYYWRYTTEDIHCDFPEVVNIDTYTVEGPDGRPVNAFHCNFFPY